MSRRARPWFRKSRSMWMLTLGDRQIPLGISDPANETGAREAAAKYLAQSASPPLGAAVAQFLARIVHRVKPETIQSYRWYLSCLVAQFGPETPIQQLTAHAVERSAQRPSWSQSTRHGYLGAIGTFLKELGHPLKLRRPPQTSRGVDSVWTDREFWAIHGAARGDLKPLLVVLRDTGARPAEVAGLTVAGVDWTNACAVLTQHKTAGKGKQRVIHFAGAGWAALEEQRRQYEQGHLFRNESDAPFKANTLHVRVKRARIRAGVKRELVLYGLRHWFATRALEGGAPTEHVAAALGNSRAMVDRHYSHLTAAAQVVRDLVEKIAGKAG